jgi:hypothetical protein
MKGRITAGARVGGSLGVRMKKPKMQLPKMNKKLLLGIAGAAIVVIGGAAFVFRGPASASGKYEYQTVAIERGTVARVVSASGAVAVEG